VNDDNLGRAALGFGGGIVGRQSECGVLVGSVMALGLKYGQPVKDVRTPEQAEIRNKIYFEGNQFLTAFAEKFGHTYCRKLTGYDFSQSDGIRGYRQDQEARQRCVGYAEFALKYFIT